MNAGYIRESAATEFTSPDFCCIYFNHRLMEQIVAKCKFSVRTNLFFLVILLNFSSSGTTELHECLLCRLHIHYRLEQWQRSPRAFALLRNRFLVSESMHCML